MIYAFVAPENCPQVHATTPQPPPAPRLDPLDLAIQQEVQRHGRYGCLIWKALNAISRAQEPGGREEQRRFRVQLWHRLKGLLHRGILFRFGRKSVSSVKVPRERAVRRKRQSLAGSTIGETSQLPGAPSINYLSGKWFKAPGLVPSRPVDAPKTQTGVRQEDLSRAGRSLAKLPRKQPRKLTGLLHGRRCWRGQRILLPGGWQAFLWACKRGKVFWSLDPNVILFGVPTAEREWGVLAESGVTLEMNAAAAILGQGKGGVKEAPSALKASAARANGCRPCRAGRRRGRPRRSPLLPR